MSANHDSAPTQPIVGYVHSFGPENSTARVQRLTDQLTNIGAKMTQKWQEMLKMGKNEPASNMQLWTLAERYSLSLAMYRTDGFHWVVLLRRPVKTAKGYEAPIYDPMHLDRQSIVIPDHHFKEPPMFLHVASDFDMVTTIKVDEDDFSMTANVPTGANDIVAQFDRLDRTLAPYDLSIPKFSGEFSGLTTAKISPLQKNDSHKCGLWCLEYAMIASGIRPGINPFKEEGIPLLGKDTGVNILTPEGII